jgi:putative flippase GtrA
MTTTYRPTSLITHLRNTSRILVKELTAFGFVGIIALAIDLGIFKLLSDEGALKAKCISTLASMTFAYIGNRYLSFSHRARTSLRRETSYFFGINLITLGFSEAILAIGVYAFHQPHGGIVIFLVNLGTIGLGTIFRFWSYKRFVFLHPDKVHAHNVDLETELAE